MSYVTWKLNGALLEVLGLKDARITYANMQPDTLEVRHLTARWDADPLFAYGETVRLDRVVVDETGVDADVVTCVFRGKCRGFPRFLGRDAESLSYTFEGIWGEFQRRMLMQNQAVVLDPEVSTVPVLIPQGLIILNQDDDGHSVIVADALELVVDAAIAAGIAIELGDIEGFDYGTAWDEVADLTLADAIIRLLGYAHDAVVHIDYAPATPVIHFHRRGGLGEVSLPISPVGAGEWPAFAAFDSLSIRARPDLVVPYVSIQFRRINNDRGTSYLTIEKQVAGAGAETDENALVRTVQLAGASFTETVLTQTCETTPLAAALTAPGLTTATSNPANFAELVKFWTRKCPELLAEGVSIKGFSGCVRDSAKVYDAAGDDVTPEVDTTLVNELITGAITPWMESAGLGRKAQDQVYQATISYHALIEPGANDIFKQVTAQFQACVQATNATTRKYSYQESSDSVPPEPAPEGVADSLIAALGTLQHEGAFTLIEQECSLSLRPGKVVNLTGGRAEWATMKGVVQAVTASLDTWRSEVSFGWPEALGPADLVEIARANRFKKGAASGLYRTTGAS